MAERRLGFGHQPADSVGGASLEEPASPALVDERSVLDDRTIAALLPERPARGHKGTFGKLLVKVKSEIIRMNHPMIKPQTLHGAPP